MLSSTQDIKHIRYKTREIVCLISSNVTSTSGILRGKARRNSHKKTTCSCFAERNEGGKNLSSYCFQNYSVMMGESVLTFAKEDCSIFVNKLLLIKRSTLTF